MGYWKWLGNNLKSLVKKTKDMLYGNIIIQAFIFSGLFSSSLTLFTLGIISAVSDEFKHEIILLLSSLIMSLITSYFYYLIIVKPKEKKE